MWPSCLHAWPVLFNRVAIPMDDFSSPARVGDGDGDRPLSRWLMQPSDRATTGACTKSRKNNCKTHSTPIFSNWQYFLYLKQYSKSGSFELPNQNMIKQLQSAASSNFKNRTTFFTSASNRPPVHSAFTDPSQNNCKTHSQFKFKV